MSYSYGRTYVMKGNRHHDKTARRNLSKDRKISVSDYKKSNTIAPPLYFLNKDSMNATHDFIKKY